MAANPNNSGATASFSSLRSSSSRSTHPACIHAQLCRLSHRAIYTPSRVGRSCHLRTVYELYAAYAHSPSVPLTSHLHMLLSPSSVVVPHFCS
jgi:hypothetical protein